MIECTTRSTVDAAWAACRAAVVNARKNGTGGAWQVVDAAFEAASETTRAFEATSGEVYGDHGERAVFAK